jgi:carbonic anhydrase
MIRWGAGILLITMALILPTGAGASQASHGRGVHWGYTGSSEPEHWGDLAPEYATCKAGAVQYGQLLSAEHSLMFC